MVRKVRGLMVIKGDGIVMHMKKSDEQIQEMFGNRVRELRKLKGLSQEALALECDLDRTYIGGVERGDPAPALSRRAQHGPAATRS